MGNALSCHCSDDYVDDEGDYEKPADLEKTPTRSSWCFSGDAASVDDSSEYARRRPSTTSTTPARVSRRRDSASSGTGRRGSATSDTGRRGSATSGARRRSSVASEGGKGTTSVDGTPMKKKKKKKKNKTPDAAADGGEPDLPSVSAILASFASTVPDGEHPVQVGRTNDEPPTFKPFEAGGSAGVTPQPSDPASISPLRSLDGRPPKAQPPAYRTPPERRSGSTISSGARGSAAASPGPGSPCGHHYSNTMPHTPGLDGERSPGAIAAQGMGHVHRRATDDGGRMRREAQNTKILHTFNTVMQGDGLKVKKHHRKEGGRKSGSDRIIRYTPDSGGVITWDKPLKYGLLPPGKNSRVRVPAITTVELEANTVWISENGTRVGFETNKPDDADLLYQAVVILVEKATNSAAISPPPTDGATASSIY